MNLSSNRQDRHHWFRSGWLKRRVCFGRAWVQRHGFREEFVDRRQGCSAQGKRLSLRYGADDSQSVPLFCEKSLSKLDGIFLPIWISFLWNRNGVAFLRTAAVFDLRGDVSAMRKNCASLRPRLSLGMNDSLRAAKSCTRFPSASSGALWEACARYLFRPARFSISSLLRDVSRMKLGQTVHGAIRREIKDERVATNARSSGAVCRDRRQKKRQRFSQLNTCSATKAFGIRLEERARSRRRLRDWPASSVILYQCCG